MPLLLLVPLLALLLAALWLVLLPLSLWARYRSGRARRRAQGWVVRTNAWATTVSLPFFLATAWWTTHWHADALRDASLGLLLGVLVGIASLWLTRFERDARGLWYTPNRWPVLLLTLLVALRLLSGAWVAWRHATGAAPTPWADALDAGAWLGVAGVFLGHALAYAWGLRLRLLRAGTA